MFPWLVPWNQVVALFSALIGGHPVTAGLQALNRTLHCHTDTGS